MDFHHLKTNADCREITGTGDNKVVIHVENESVKNVGLR